MKKTFLFFTLLFVVVTTAQAKIIIIKPWQTMLNAGGGTNYQGWEIQGNVSTRFNSTNLGLYIGTEYDYKTVTMNSDLGSFDGPLKTLILDAGAYYSFYEKMVPFPLDIRVHLGFIYAFETVDKPDASQEKSNTAGNSFGVTFNYYFSKHISIFLRQNAYATYNSTFGVLSGSTNVGISILF